MIHERQSSEDLRMQLEDALSREERNMEDMEAIQMHLQVGIIIIIMMMMITIIIIILITKMYFPPNVLATNCNFLFILYA